VARKLDVDPSIARDPVGLGYDADVIASLVRIVTVWTSDSFQRLLVGRPDLPDQALTAIHLLAARGAHRPAQLAAPLHLSPAGASRLVEALAQAGLVARAADPTDARATLVGLTDAGVAFSRELVRIGDDLAADLLGDWTAADRDALASLVHRFADAVDARARREA